MRAWIFCSALYFLLLHVKSKEDANSTGPEGTVLDSIFLCICTYMHMCLYTDINVHITVTNYDRTVIPPHTC